MTWRRRWVWPCSIAHKAETQKPCIVHMGTGKSAAANGLIHLCCTHFLVPEHGVLGNDCCRWEKMWLILHWPCNGSSSITAPVLLGSSGSRGCSGETDASPCLSPRDTVSVPEEVSWDCPPHCGMFVPGIVPVPSVYLEEIAEGFIMVHGCSVWGLVDILRSVGCHTEVSLDWTKKRFDWMVLGSDYLTLEVQWMEYFHGGLNYPEKQIYRK
jgi:hypothetical protein